MDDCLQNQKIVFEEHRVVPQRTVLVLYPYCQTRINVDKMMVVLHEYVRMKMMVVLLLLVQKNFQEWNIQHDPHEVDDD